MRLYDAKNISVLERKRQAIATEFRTASQLEEPKHPFHSLWLCLGSLRDRSRGRDCCSFLWGKSRLTITFKRRPKLGFESYNQRRDTTCQGSPGTTFVSISHLNFGGEHPRLPFPKFMLAKNQPKVKLKMKYFGETQCFYSHTALELQ